MSEKPSRRPLILAIALVVLAVVAAAAFIVPTPTPARVEETLDAGTLLK